MRRASVFLLILIVLLPVAVFPRRKDILIDYEVTVEVARFEGALSSSCWLVAHWTVFARDVAAQSRLVAGLGRDIATAFKAIPQ